MSDSQPVAAKPPSDTAFFCKYADWKKYGHHYEEYACEFIGTAWLMFAIVATVALMFSHISPMHRWIPSTLERLFCAGALIGSSGSLFTVTALGRLSGAHLNPAISLGFAVLGKMHGRDFVGYVAAQFCGALLGSITAKWALGIPAVQVDQAALNRPPNIGLTLCLCGEFAATFAYCYAIYVLVSHEKLMRWTPLINIPLAATIVCADGKISGAGFNPARWFGPAVITGTWWIWWVYLVGPMIAAALAGTVRKAWPITGHETPRSGKLFHDSGFRSIFKHDAVPSAAPTNDAPGV